LYSVVTMMTASTSLITVNKFLTPSGKKFHANKNCTLKLLQWKYV